jgi:DNA topoisomerase-1
MSKSLVIVESPAKAKTINRYLGSDYVVEPSMGHVRDLPKSKMGVDIEHDFAPQYIVIADRRKVVTALKKEAETADLIYLAADPDREGEAICWHLREILKNGHREIRRVLMSEITKKGVTEAFEHWTDLDENKVKAQQTRRILDRLVGYLISPLLWKKVGRGLSAGRVQSVALRLICDRERQIQAFVPEEYWTIAAQLRAANPPDFKAALVKHEGKKIKLENGEQANEALERLKQEPFRLQEIKVKKKKKEPPPPYITSSLQQDGFRALRFPVRKTMSVAQKLYEGLELGDRGQVGLITYMRTDSFRVADEALSWVRSYIGSTYGPDHLPAKPRVFTTKKKVQDAHEAIRPTSSELPPQVVKPYLKKEEYSLYKLIWERFVASQMSPAVVEETEFDIRSGAYQFQAKGEVLIHEGYLAVYPGQKREGSVLPKAAPGETLTLLGLEPKQNFTQPPARFTEGTLVKELEARGIGRPSTYAPIIATLQNRVYVVKEEGKFQPTELGLFVVDFLIKHFSDLMDYKFTARMEEDLDRVSIGEVDWVEELRSYYSRLDSDMKKAGEAEGVTRTGIPLEEKCPLCGKQVVIKSGRYGRFKACSGYPECQYKESLKKSEAKPLDEKCPECGSNLVQRRGRYGLFIACSNYPACKYIKKEQTDTGIACPLGCGGTILRRRTRRGRYFYGCSRYPHCKFATWELPYKKACPRCGRPFMLLKQLKNKPGVLRCWDEACGYTETLPPGFEVEAGTKPESEPKPEGETKTEGQARPGGEEGRAQGEGGPDSESGPEGEQGRAQGEERSGVEPGEEAEPEADAGTPSGTEVEEREDMGPEGDSNGSGESEAEEKPGERAPSDSE